MRWIASRQVVAGYGEGLLERDRRHRNPANGRQGKRPAFGAAYVVGGIREFANVLVTPCWRSRQILEGIQCLERRRAPSQCGFGP